MNQSQSPGYEGASVDGDDRARDRRKRRALARGRHRQADQNDPVGPIHEHLFHGERGPGALANRRERVPHDGVYLCGNNPQPRRNTGATQDKT